MSRRDLLADAVRQPDAGRSTRAPADQRDEVLDPALGEVTELARARDEPQLVQDLV